MKVSTLLVPSCLAYVTNAMIRDPAFAGVQTASSMEKDLLIRDITEIPALDKRAEDVQQPDNANVGPIEHSVEREESGQGYLQKRGSQNSKDGRGGRKDKERHGQSKKKGRQQKDEKRRENDENTRFAVSQAEEADRLRGPPPDVRRFDRERDRTQGRIQGNQAAQRRRRGFRDEAMALGYVGSSRREFDDWLQQRQQGMNWGSRDRERLLGLGIPVSDETTDPAPAFENYHADVSLPPEYSKDPQFNTAPPSYRTNPSSRRSSRPRDRSSQRSSRPSQRSSRSNQYSDPNYQPLDLDPNAVLDAPFDAQADLYSSGPSRRSNRNRGPSLEPAATLSGPFLEGQYPFGGSGEESGQGFGGEPGQPSRRSGQSSRRPRQSGPRPPSSRRRSPRPPYENDPRQPWENDPTQPRPPWENDPTQPRPPWGNDPTQGGRWHF